MQFIPISELQANRHFTEHLQMMTEYFSECIFQKMLHFLIYLKNIYPFSQHIILENRQVHGKYRHKVVLDIFIDSYAFYRRPTSLICVRGRNNVTCGAHDSPARALRARALASTSPRILHEYK